MITSVPGFCIPITFFYSAVIAVHGVTSFLTVKRLAGLFQCNVRKLEECFQLWFRRLLLVRIEIDRQRNSGLFCKFCTSRACSRLNVFKTIMSSYLSIAWNISFNHASLELEVTTNFIGLRRL